MAIHWFGCTLNGSHQGTPCRDSGMNVLGSTDDCRVRCELGEHTSVVPCLVPEKPIPGRPPATGQLLNPAGARAVPPPATTVPPPPPPPASGAMPQNVKVTRLDVVIPAGPQPAEPGPLHAVIRGPGGLDVTVSADQFLFGRLLSAIGDVFSFAVDA